MYKFIKNKYIRNFIIIFSLISCISFGYKQEKVQAIAIVDDAIAIGSVFVAPEVVGALAVAGIAYSGYKIVGNFKEDIQNYVVSKLTKKGLEKYFKYTLSKDGNEYVSLTKDGINEIQGITKEAISSKNSTIPINFKSDNNSMSYEVNDFITSESATGKINYIKYTRLADVLTNDMYIGCYRVTGNCDFYYKSASSGHGRTLSGSNANPSYYRVRYVHSDSKIYFDKGTLTSDINDDSTWKLKSSYLNVSNKENAFLGIQVDAPVTSSLPGCFIGNAVQGLASDQVATGNVVAVPISGQYENSSGSKVYGIDGAVGEFSGLSSDTTTVPSEGSSTESTESTGVISGVINAVGDKVSSAVSAVESAIGSVGSAIKSVLSSIANTVTKIYDWACDLVGDIVNAFSGWLDTIISLLNQIVTVISDIVVNIVNALIDGLLSLLQSVFVPAADFFMNNFNEIKGMIFDKIGYDQYVDIFGDGSSKELKDITINWYGKTIVICKLTTFNYFRNLFNDLVYGFTFFGLAIYNYNQIYRIFRNNNYAKMEQTIERMKK